MTDTGLAILAPLRIEAVAAARGSSTATVRRTGMGSKRARSSASKLGSWLRATERVAIVGFCGSLDDSLRPGDVLVASELWSVDGAIAIELPEMGLLAGELRSTGARVQCGPLISGDRVVTGEQRAALRERGALAVDMESAWLAEGARASSPDGALVVVRVVLDSPGHELRTFRAPRNLVAATRRLRQIVPVLERWARAVGPRRVVLCSPRSFCAGVERAIDIVERAIDRFPAPVYVRRQVIHNTHVVRDLERRGAVFVQEVDEVPPGSTVVLAAHGVAPHVRADAEARDLRVIDATCPLVAKVHVEARRFAKHGYDIVLVGHADHEEIEGTVGEAPERITVVASASEVDALEVEDPERVAYLTQTTLAVDETAEIVTRLKDRFPSMVGPHSDDICYATQFRQEAVAAVAARSDVVLVVGSPNSSNSKRLTEVASRAGCRAHLVDGCAEVRLEWLEGARTVGITAGASAPEAKVAEVVAALRSLGAITVEEHRAREESVTFALPAEVR